MISNKTASTDNVKTIETMSKRLSRHRRCDRRSLTHVHLATVSQFFPPSGGVHCSPSNQRWTAYDRTSTPIGRRAIKVEEKSTPTISGVYISPRGRKLFILFCLWLYEVFVFETFHTMDMCWGEWFVPNDEEDFKFDIELILDDFMHDDSLKQFVFPPILNSNQRRCIHEKCKDHDLMSKSNGREPARFLTVYKTDKLDDCEIHELKLSQAAVDAIDNFVQSNPEIERNNVDTFDNFSRSAFGKLNIGLAVIPERPNCNPFKDVRESLPIFTYREDFLEMVEQKQVVVVCARAGSGKTTQIPQYLLEWAFAKGERCRVVSVQPSKLTALCVSERVAAERGEDVGVCVGYQIKLESKMGPRTGVVFCTADILLRTLMTGESCFDHMTHIVVDEVQERGKLTDFLLICLRECLKRHPPLRIVLLSTDANYELYTNYFEDDIEVLNVPGRSYRVNEFFLEDVLKMINEELEPMRRRQEMRSNVCFDLEEPTVKEMEVALQSCMASGAKEDFSRVLLLVVCKKMPVNFTDFEYGYTPLIAAAAHGNICCVRKLVKMGANVSMRTVNGLTALSWAKHYGQEESAEFLENCAQEVPPKKVEESLTNYNAVLHDETISQELIVAVIQFIHHSLDRRGTVLVFLPSHEDVVNCAERINEKFDTGSLQICMLHENVPPELQELFAEVPGKQKIVLATKIAEAVVTIDRVRFVIDTGFKYEDDYDWVSEMSTLTKAWISKASVRQRTSRADQIIGGVCFHLFPKNQYAHYPEEDTAEIRRVFLQELCLMTKMLVPNEITIAEFLSRAVEPPPDFLVESAIESLVTLGALDERERLTSMGRHLVQFSVEPNLGKMLLYGTAFKCLDPVLTIVACLSQKDPFVVPSKRSMRMEALRKKKALASGSLSDHMCLLMCFQMWQEAKVHNREQLFCSSNFVCSTTMSAINNVRIQLLGQLRASGFVPSYPRDAIYELNVNSENWGVVKAALAVGIYPRVAYSEGGHLYTPNFEKVSINPMSSLRNTICDSTNRNNDTPNLWVMFDGMSMVGSVYNINGCSAISPITICLVGGRTPCYNPESGVLSIDEFVAFSMPTTNIAHFRLALSNMIERKIRNVRARPNRFDERVLQTFVAVMAAEDNERCLIHPWGFGKRPKIIYHNRYERRSLNASANNTLANLERKSSATRSSVDSRSSSSSNDWMIYSRWFDLRSLNTPESNGSFANVQRESNESPSLSSRNDGVNKSVRFRRFDNRAHRGSCSSSPTASFAGQPRIVELPSNNNVQNPICKPDENSLRDEASGGVNWNAQRNDLSRPGPSNASTFRCETGLSLNVIVPREIAVNENTLFFIIKPNEVKNVIISVSQSTWNFAPQTEKKLFKYFKEGWMILLLYTVRGTKMFQGVARLMGTNNGVPNSPCAIKWLGTNPVPYARIKHILHPKLHICEDGQEVEYDAGRIVSRMLMESPPAPGGIARPVLGAS